MPPARQSKKNTGPWSTTRILNSSSPVVNTDLHAFLITAISGWSSDHESYTEAEKRSIIDSLPPAHQKYELDDEGLLRCPLSVDDMLDDPHIKAAIQKFKADVSDGYYEKGWQTRARKAMQDRREGKFETYLQEHVEETFGDCRLDEPDGSTEDTRDDTQENSSDGEWCSKITGRGNRQMGNFHPRLARQKRKV